MRFDLTYTSATMGFLSYLSILCADSNYVFSLTLKGFFLFPERELIAPCHLLVPRSLNGCGFVHKWCHPPNWWFPYEKLLSTWMVTVRYHRGGQTQVYRSRCKSPMSSMIDSRRPASPWPQLPGPGPRETSCSTDFHCGRDGNSCGARPR